MMMKKSLAIIVCLILFSIAGCEFISFDEHNVDEYTGDFTWTQIVKNADWDNRWDHASLVFNDKLWIIGGYNSGNHGQDPYYEDVWSSEDGENWTLVLEDAPWKGRRGHQLISFENAMYLIGGFYVDEANGYRNYANDVWKSTDGEVWIEIKPIFTPELDSLIDWYPRFNHSCTVAMHGGINYIYLIGGATMIPGKSGEYAVKYFNDVWRSTDGIKWEQMPANDFGIRSEHALTVDSATGTLYLQGGIHGRVFESADQSKQPIPDWHWLWTSTDGVNWIPANDLDSFNQSYLYRAQHQMMFYDNYLWTFPGKHTYESHYSKNDNYYTIWKRDDVNNWTIDSHGAPFSGRYGYTLEKFQGNIWILGGVYSYGGPSNDIWKGEYNK